MPVEMTEVHYFTGGDTVPDWILKGVDTDTGQPFPQERITFTVAMAAFWHGGMVRLVALESGDTYVHIEGFGKSNLTLSGGPTAWPGTGSKFNVVIPYEHKVN